MRCTNSCAKKAGAPPAFLFARESGREGVMVRREDLQRLAKQRGCPRCSLDKTEGTALCRRCRFKLPPQMRMPLEGITKREEWVVYGALRAAANYFDVHYRSIRDFGGGRMRNE
jgi:hypothetical protein